MAITKKEDKKDLNQGEKQNLASSENNVFPAQENASKEVVEDKKLTVEVKTEEEAQTHDELILLREELAKQKEVSEKMQEQLAELLRMGAVQTAKKTDGASDYTSKLNNDWVEKPEVFFAFSFRFSIWGDKKEGRESMPPNGAVKFSPIIRSKRQGQRGVEVISVSHYASNSKSEIEYLKKHSKFGILFYQNQSKVTQMDYVLAQKLAESNNQVQSMNDQQIIARCKNEGIDVLTDVSTMRSALTEHIAKKNFGIDKSMLYSKIEKNNFEEGRIIEKGTVTV